MAYTREVINHFKDRCAACGLRGHRSNDQVCPQFHSTTTSTLCRRCHAGFHRDQDCSYPSELVQALN